MISLLFVLTGLMSQMAFAGSAGYKYDSVGDIVRNSSGECWRTSSWSSSNSIAECEGGEAPKVDGDADKDGVVDSMDKCPGTTNVTVDSKGCPRDGDNDGVADAKDRCPSTPAGVRVDMNGCDVNKDSDKDGIPDSADKCPGTAAGTVVNNTGCPLKANISLSNVRFNTATAVLDAESRTILDGIAKTLNANKHLNFEVAGHTDSTGSYAYNVDLSTKRANSVRKYLANKGVAANRLTAKGYGPDKPVASNSTKAGRHQNRRVELVAK